MIKYRFAKLIDNSVFSIDEISKQFAQENNFFCIGCGNELIPKMGLKNRKHFAHKTDCTASKETYLHKAGKQIFKENYLYHLTNKKSLTVDYYSHHLCDDSYSLTNHVCDIGQKVEKFDLIKSFPFIEEEKSYQNFRPDLRIFSNSHSIFIEIAVTHKSSKAKLSSSHKIIEFHIKTEDDLSLLSSSEFTLSDPRITYYNFTSKKKKGKYCRNREKGCFTAFYLYYVNANLEPTFVWGRFENLLTDHFDYIENSLWYSFQPDDKFTNWDNTSIINYFEEAYSQAPSK